MPRQRKLTLLSDDDCENCGGLGIVPVMPSRNGAPVQRLNLCYCVSSEAEPEPEVHVIRGPRMQHCEYEDEDINDSVESEPDVHVIRGPRIQHCEYEGPHSWEELEESLSFSRVVRGPLEGAKQVPLCNVRSMGFAGHKCTRPVGHHGPHSWQEEREKQ